MEAIHLTATVSTNRVLRIEIPGQEPEAELEVTVLLQPKADDAGRPRMDRTRWARIVDETAGAFADKPLEIPSDPAPGPVEVLI